MTTNTLPMLTLALSDAWLITIVILNLLGMFISLYISISSKRSNTEKDNLRADVKKYAESAIVQKFNALRVELMGKIDSLGEKFESIQNRLTSGDRKFDSQYERDHQIELKTLTALTELRQDLAERFATKAELHEFGERLRRQEQKCATNHAGDRT